LVSGGCGGGGVWLLGCGRDLKGMEGGGGGFI